MNDNIFLMFDNNVINKYKFDLAINKFSHLLRCNSNASPNFRSNPLSKTCHSPKQPRTTTFHRSCLRLTKYYKTENTRTSFRGPAMVKDSQSRRLSSSHRLSYPYTSDITITRHLFVSLTCMTSTKPVNKISKTPSKTFCSRRVISTFILNFLDIF